VLSRYLGITPIDVRLQYETTGKPALDPSHQSELHFNVSHSETLAVYAVTRVGRVGIDVERRRDIPNAESLVERFFTQRERDFFQTIPINDRLAAFFRAWTRKEAVLKAVGQGVQALDQCDVTFGPNEPEAVLRMGDDCDCQSKWLLRSWEPESGYSAAVAVELG
jgi:4'-phosphopantetheinyl transferase